jgi:hypothetical protein
MSLDRFRYELRIMGKWVLVIPLLIMLSFAFLAAILTLIQVSHLRSSQVLTGSLEMVLPLAAGLLMLKPVFLFPTTLAPDINFWLSNRFEVPATALVLILLGWFLMHNTELLLQEAAGEE